MTSAKAEKIRELREARGMTVEDLSHHMGVDAAAVRRWESGEEEIGAGALAQICMNDSRPRALRRITVSYRLLRPALVAGSLSPVRPADLHDRPGRRVVVGRYG